jgi:hypothetical protein
VNGTIIHVSEDGKVTNVTAAVQALYDLAVGSMDYQSGFWTYEDASPVAELAERCGFEGHEGISKYARDELHKREASAWQRDNLSGGGSFGYEWRVPHEHAFSVAGRCMWPGCPEEKPE